MTTLACTSSNKALCDLAQKYVSPICTVLLCFLAGYLVVALVINIGQATLSGSLGDPRGRAHALEQAIAAVILFVIGANAQNFVNLILLRLTYLPAASGASASRIIMSVLFEIIIELFTGLVLIGSALRFVTSLTALNISHQFGSSGGFADAIVNIGVTLLTMMLVLALPWLAHQIVMATLGS